MKQEFVDGLNALRSKVPLSFLFSFFPFHWKKSQRGTKRREKNEKKE